MMPPSAPPNAPSVIMAYEPPRSDSTPIVLVADDDQGVREILAASLEGLGFSVILASSGTEALELIRSRVPDLALLDFRMPGLSGLEVVQAVRTERSSTALPLIIMSVESESHTIVQALEMGANDYLSKPVALEVLAARVRTQLELKRLQDLHIRHIAELQNLDALKNQFFQMAAHDLRNPLNLIQFGVEMLAMSGDDPLSDDERERVLDAVRESIQTMKSIIDDFLDLRALKEGNLALAQETLALDQMAGRAVDQFRVYAEQKRISLSFETRDDLPPLTGDPDRLKQVIHNLISNAIKFSPAGARVQVRVTAREGWLRLEVLDSGPGIPPDELPLLFQEFTRLSNRPTGQERSSGVGLSIARRLVELHGGRIGAESAVGHGSLFWVELPAA